MRTMFSSYTMSSIYFVADTNSCSCLVQLTRVIRRMGAGTPTLAALLRTLPALLLLAGLTGCGGSEPQVAPPVTPPEQPVAQHVFQQLGLSGLTVERLYQQQDSILALTSDGLYQQRNNSDWQLLGFRGLQPKDLAFITEQHWLLAVTVVHDDGEQVHQIHESFDAGRSWTQVKRPFGTHGDSEAIYALRYAPAAKKLYATGVGVLAESADFGISWRVLDGQWGGFGQPKSALALDPRSDDIWWGGQGALEDGVLTVYRRASQRSQSFRDLLPNPSVYYNIRFAPAAGGPSLIYACGEGGIVFSADQGNSWRNLLGNVNYRFYFDVVFDNNHNNRLYTAGWDKKFDEPQPLILQWSDDQGASWQRLQYEAPASFFGGVRSMLLVQQQNQTYLYLGLFKGGVMRVSVNR